MLVQCERWVDEVVSFSAKVEMSEIIDAVLQGEYDLPKKYDSKQHEVNSLILSLNLLHKFTPFMQPFIFSQTPPFTS